MNEPTPQSNNTQEQPAIRDVLGGDEGKSITVAAALGDSLEKRTTDNGQRNENTPDLSVVDRPLATPAIDTTAPTLEEDLEPQRPQPTPKASPVPVAEKPKQVEEQTPAQRAAIRTLQSDIASSVKYNNLSLAKIALARQEKTSNIEYATEEKRSFWSVWSIGAIVLVLAGVAAVAGAIVFVQQTNIPLPFIPAAAPAPTLIPVESRTTFDVTRATRSQLLQSIDTFTNKNFSSPVAIEAFIMQEVVGTSTDATQIDIERFFDILGTRAPGRLVRSIGPTMTLGRVGGTPFLITRAPSYETTFDAMLEWEPLMAADLSMIAYQEPIPEPVVVEQATSTASTTETQTATTTGLDAEELPPVAPPPPPPAPTWKDIIVKNKDVRALIDHKGTVLILYAFPKDGYLVIAQNKEALVVIDDALNSPVFGR